MRRLLNTHVILWWVNNKLKLGNVIEDIENIKY